jgi:hypothetical protein
MATASRPPRHESGDALVLIAEPEAVRALVTSSAVPAALFPLEPHRQNRLAVVPPLGEQADRLRQG